MVGIQHPPFSKKNLMIPELSFYIPYYYYLLYYLGSTVYVQESHSV